MKAKKSLERKLVSVKQRSIFLPSDYFSFLHGKQACLGSLDITSIPKIR